MTTTTTTTTTTPTEPPRPNKFSVSKQAFKEAPYISVAFRNPDLQSDADAIAAQCEAIEGDAQVLGLVKRDVKSELESTIKTMLRSARASFTPVPAPAKASKKRPSSSSSSALSAASPTKRRRPEPTSYNDALQESNQTSPAKMVQHAMKVVENQPELAKLVVQQRDALVQVRSQLPPGASIPPCLRGMMMAGNVVEGLIIFQKRAFKKGQHAGAGSPLGAT